MGLFTHLRNIGRLIGDLPDADKIGGGALQAAAEIMNGQLASPKAYFTVGLHCSRQLTASVTGVFGFQMPFAATLIEVCAAARASGGTTPTLTIDVQEAGVTVLTTPITVTAGANTVAAPSDAAIADNAAVTVNAAIGGTSPTWDDITVLLTFKAAHTA